jgi:hypothetical protein
MGKAPSACEGLTLRHTTFHTHLGQWFQTVDPNHDVVATCTTEVQASFDLVSSNRSSSILPLKQNTCTEHPLIIIRWKIDV